KSRALYSRRSPHLFLSPGVVRENGTRGYKTFHTQCPSGLVVENENDDRETVPPYKGRKTDPGLCLRELHSAGLHECGATRLSSQDRIQPDYDRNDLCCQRDRKHRWLYSLRSARRSIRQEEVSDNR